MSELRLKPDARPVSPGDLVATRWYDDQEWSIGIVDYENSIEGSSLFSAHHVVLIKGREEMDRLAGDAVQKAFAEVSLAFPEIVTGDFSPEDTEKIEYAMKEAIVSWVRWNYPK